jgi:hypothetical protein
VEADLHCKHVIKKEGALRVKERGRHALNFGISWTKRDMDM